MAHLLGASPPTPAIFLLQRAAAAHLSFFQPEACTLPFLSTLVPITPAADLAQVSPEPPWSLLPPHTPILIFLAIGNCIVKHLLFLKYYLHHLSQERKLLKERNDLGPRWLARGQGAFRSSRHLEDTLPLPSTLRSLLLCIPVLPQPPRSLFPLLSLKAMRCAQVICNDQAGFLPERQPAVGRKKRG